MQGWLWCAHTHTPRIQECHLVAWHLVCEAVELEIVAERLTSRP